MSGACVGGGGMALVGLAFSSLGFSGSSVGGSGSAVVVAVLFHPKRFFFGGTGAGLPARAPDADTGTRDAPLFIARLADVTGLFVEMLFGIEEAADVPFFISIIYSVIIIIIMPILSTYSSLLFFKIAFLL